MQISKLGLAMNSVVLRNAFRACTASEIALDGSRYHLVPMHDLEIASPEDVLPVTVLNPISSDGHDARHHFECVNRWLAEDDLFSPAFLKHVLLIIGDNDSPHQSKAVHDLVQNTWATEKCTVIKNSSLSTKISSGPHFLKDGVIMKPYRLIDDVQSAFMLPTILEDDKQSHRKLGLAGDYPSSLSVAIPSRVPLDLDTPVCGYRFAVKDLFLIKGLRPTVGCRAYYAVAETASETAPIIQTLLDKNAHLLGTLKLGSLITKEEPAESADYLAPFNPRGDGYQSAWSSSGGSGAAIASYDWLDFTLGTDTTGSSRRPALANGCFQIRLSHDSVDQTGIVPSWRPFDAPAIFARELKVLRNVAQALLPEEDAFSKKPTRLVYLTDYFPLADDRQQALFENFLSDIEEVFSIQRTRISLRSQWRKTMPAEASESSLDTYLEKVGVTSFCYGLYHELDEFREQYHKAYDREPYVNPTTRWRWDAARNVTSEQHAEALGKLHTYKTWLLEEILQTRDQNTLVVIPITEQQPDYRDQAVDPPSEPLATQQLWLAPIMGAPELSVPIGEIRYKSRVSLVTEYLPVVASIMSAPGTDHDLLQMMSYMLEKSGRPAQVSTGRRML